MTYKSAYTARELADLKLEGWPTHLSNFLTRAKKEGWPSSPRSARGGGVEYPFASLPVELQKAIIFKLAAEAELNKASSSLAALAPVKAAQRVTGEDRRNAKLTIVALFEKFRASCGMPVMDAEDAFIALYNTERGKGAGGMIPAWIFEIYPDFSARSLHRWRSLSEKDVKSLGGRYGNRKGTSVIHRAENGSVAEFIAAALVSNTHLKAGHIRDLCRAKFGNTLNLDGKEVPLPKIRAFERHIAAWKVEHADVHEYLTHPDSYKNKRMLALGRADAHVHGLNQEWQIDASPADILCTDGRYSIYAIIDVWSRRALFSVTKTPRTEASLLLIRRAIMEWGVPETIKTDNGSDFTSKRFCAALLGLGINHDICPPYSPEKKPFVERVIKTLQHDLMVLLPGFVGHNVADRKRIEAKKSFAQSLGESDEKAFAVEIGHAELQQRIDEWVKFKYAQHEHKALGGQTPFARAAAWTQPIRKIENARALDLLLAPLAGTDGFRVIGKKGLRINNGYFYGAGIELYVGKRVMVRHDPEDMGRVFVFTEENQFICEAIDHEMLGTNPQEAIAAAKARQKQHMADGTKELRRQARAITPAKMTRDILSLHAQAAAKVTSFPKQTETYTTDALDSAGRAVTKDSIPAERTQEQKAQQDAFIIKFNQRQQNAASSAKGESDADRWWNRAKEIEARIAAGGNVTDEERDWLANIAQPSTWYKSRTRFDALKAATENGV